MIGKYNPDTTYFIDNKYHWDLMCIDPNKSIGVGLSSGAIHFGDAGVFQAEYKIKRKLQQDYDMKMLWGKPKTN